MSKVLSEHDFKTGMSVALELRKRYAGTMDRIFESHEELRAICKELAEALERAWDHEGTLHGDEKVLEKFNKVVGR